MFRRIDGRVLFAVGAVVLAMGSSAYGADSSTKPVSRPMTKGQLIEHGRYVLLLGGCNDCHTVGYPESGGKTPEAERLTGNPVGFQGPWGTSYATNLRLYFQTMSSDQWVKVARTLKAAPPMPWFTINQLTETDLRSMHAYITSLGPAGVAMPKSTPPSGPPPTK